MHTVDKRSGVTLIGHRARIDIYGVVFTIINNRRAIHARGHVAIGFSETRAAINERPSALMRRPLWSILQSKICVTENRKPNRIPLAPKTQTDGDVKSKG